MEELHEVVGKKLDDLELRFQQQPDPSTTVNAINAAMVANEKEAAKIQNALEEVSSSAWRLKFSYAARLQEFQDARKEFAKLSAKNDAPSEAALAAVAPYFEAEEEHRGQLAEEQSQEELLRQTAKTRYHGALRSLETLSNQAHLRRASSGVLEPVSRTATEERQERMMKRSPTCQTPERPTDRVLRPPPSSSHPSQAAQSAAR
eukprot:g16247.t1